MSGLIRNITVDARGFAEATVGGDRRIDHDVAQNRDNSSLLFDRLI